MDKFKYLVGYGLKKRVKRKAFVISNIVILFLLVLVINIPNLINLFTSSKTDEISYNIDFYNNTDEENFAVDFKEMLNANLEEEMFVFTTPDVPFEEDEFWKDSKKDVAIIINGTVKNPEILIYTDDTLLYANLSRALEILIINYQVENYTEPVINLVLSPDYENPEESMIISSITSVLVLPMFMLVIIATQFVGVDIIEEKSTKAIETIISSVPANTHFFSKIIASVLFVIIQGSLVFIYGAIGLLVSKAFSSANLAGSAVGGSQANLLLYVAEILPNWPVALTITVFFMIFGTLLYLVIAALFASMAVTQEDYQQFQTPLMLILLGSFYAAMFGPMAGANTFVKVLSFIPFVAPMLTPVAFASGFVSLVEALISLLILILTLVLLTYLFTPVYKISILSYDQTKFFKRIKSYFKKGFQKTNNNK